jgi:hypothetical protein
VSELFQAVSQKYPKVNNVANYLKFPLEAFNSGIAQQSIEVKLCAMQI